MHFLYTKMYYIIYFICFFCLSYTNFSVCTLSAFNAIATSRYGQDLQYLSSHKSKINLRQLQDNGYALGGRAFWSTLHRGTDSISSVFTSGIQNTGNVFQAGLSGAENIAQTARRSSLKLANQAGMATGNFLTDIARSPTGQQLIAPVRAVAPAIQETFRSVLNVFRRILR